jgi:prepilin-type N-terminal cleavage/methylation domain-containing protein
MRNTEMTRQERNSAFTLAEMLLALTVSAMLLAAIATAMHASLVSYKENQQIATVTQTARSTLSRMTRDIRTAEAINHTTNALTIIPPNDGSGITEIQYQFTGGELIYRVTKNGTQTSSPLIATGDEVQIYSFSITPEMGQDWQGFNCVKSLAMRITFEIDGKQFAHAASARPRRNMVY